MVKMDDMSACFSGDKLYGDDFNETEISEWYKDEAEAYANLGAKNRSAYKYSYHAINWLHGYRHIRDIRFDHALGLGSAYGDEFIPISGQVSRISIVDPSDAFQVRDVGGTQVTYYKAEKTGNLPLANDSVDLVTCFGVLHHIPNVSHVVAELYRCMVKGGVGLVREPTVSMGDWRKPRAGLTKRERGIPHNVLRNMFIEAGFTIEHVTECFFPLTPRVSKIFGISPYNNKIVTVLDEWVSHAFKWNYSYHRQSLASRFAPTAAFWVLRK